MASSFAALSLLLVASLLFAEKRSHRGLVVVSKTAASIAFVAAGAAALPLATPFGRLVLTGLALSAVGDVLLLHRSERAFTAGLGAFLFGHVAYGAAFVARGVSPFATEGAALPAAGLAALVLAWLLPRVPSPLRVPVIAYAVVISAMVALAVGATAHGATRWLLVAAIAFYVSDLSVARDRFVAPGFVNRAWGLPVYYAAQITFALWAR